jgi:hypothetical protein
MMTAPRFFKDLLKFAESVFYYYNIERTLVHAESKNERIKKLLLKIYISWRSSS